MQKEVLMAQAKFFTANSNTELAGELATHIKATFRDSELVFQPVHIITPNKAQHQWLKEKLAEELGFIANLEQYNLNSFFKKLIGSLDPTTKDKPRKEKFIWKLFSEMGKAEFKNLFQKIKTYCGEDEIKRLALAQKLAGLFEDYLEFDPEGRWKESTDKEDLEWQLWLFEKCEFEQLQISPAQFEILLRRNPKVLEKFHSLYLFGNLEISPLHLKYLKALAEVENFRLHIYRTHLRFDHKENPLAQNWGDHLTRTNNQLNQLGNLPENPTLPEADNLLGRIQKDILTDSISKELPKDDSILIYNSFTRVREVEALYNYLVKTVDESEGKLGARDIMVCMPSLDPYISAIKTVFDSAPYKFPYTLVSRGYSREESFWTALEQVLSFEKEDFTAPGVFNLLEMQPIQKSFDFQDLDLLKKAFIDANIRREYEGDEELETNYASFSYGLNRLIYGFCLGSEEPVEIGGKKMYPVDIAEGQQANDLFRLHHLVELLNNFLKIKAEKQSAADWHTKLMEIADEFLEPEEWQQKHFLDLMLELGGMEASAGEKIEFKTFFFRLKDQLLNKDLQQLKGQGGITFSGLYPGMIMPKKVVALLGLNFKEFPRRSQELSFDLLPENKKPETRILDRGAFLETFLNAEQKVLLSYIGQNVKDNSEIPSSSLINELQDYVEKTGAKIKEVKHHLHSYNSKYFVEDKDYFTYLIGNDNKLNTGKKATESQKKAEVIHLFSLENFLKDPFKHYYHHVLNIYYQDDVNMPDWEMFEPNKLEEWNIKYSVLNQNLKVELDPVEQREILINNGMIPLKTPGEIVVDDSQRKVRLLTEKLCEISSDEISEIEFDLPFYFEESGNHILKCKIPMLGGQGLYLSVSKLKSKYKLAAYLKYLTLVAADKASQLNYFLLEEGEKEAKIISYSGLMTKEQARQILRDWLSLYLKNFERIQAFSPEFDFAINDLGEELNDLQIKINNKFERPYGFFPSDYLKAEYRDGFFENEDNLDDFKSNYKLIMQPVELANSK
ncbi:exodeoxyribonuclease V subunit gamma [Salegentibacter sp. BDJ18]|uniref:exodeoxyribonuclease V subunit gamma n=1 Tax=Salegentibacter sp. BDJ18 TaxID=2816376 RepID=UPI001AAFEA92|nr:exodeoxyribonuclease V subunit gamma [Salegentibacter sp. BDJ18]MBO2546021.1 exodeoxyribonuclease V subunit gamma [Salegentibacter sp. BDJ18]